MSYNGIGLSTVRGSGTNGYVQRNLAAIRRIREKVGINSDDQGSLESSLEKKPNLELLEHDRKRRVEIKCMELQDLMEEQGYDEDEISKKVDSYRQMLSEAQDCLPGKDDAGGRPIITTTHQIAEMKEKENEMLRSAFGIREDYVKGSAFMKTEMPKGAEAVEKKYKLVRSPSRSPSPAQRRSSEKIGGRRRKKSVDDPERSLKKSRKNSSNDEFGRDQHSKKSKHAKRHKKKEKHSKHSRARSAKHKKKSRRYSESESSSGS